MRGLGVDAENGVAVKQWISQEKQDDSIDPRPDVYWKAINGAKGVLDVFIVVTLKCALRYVCVCACEQRVPFLVLV